MSKDGHVLTFNQDNTKSKPNEDFCLAGEGKPIFAVADGVSRSRKENGDYPEISARCAAEVFCHSAVSALQANMPMYEAFRLANENIGALNSAHGIQVETVDFLHRDYLCCAAASALWIQEYPNVLFHGHIGDCGVLVYDADFFPVFMSENTLGILEQFREGWGYWTKDEKMKFWRRELRNHTTRRMSYGVLTGEFSALTHVKCGYTDVRPGDTVILFSDGMYPFLFDRAFRILITELLQVSDIEQSKQAVIQRYLAAATKELQKKSIQNLDDDRTFIAFKIGG